MMHADLSDTTVAITGASSGLGRHFAQVLATAGADVIALARRAEPLAELAAHVPNIRAHCMDVTLEEDRAVLTDALNAQSRERVVLINNAGHADPAPALTTSPEDFSQVLEINTTAPFALSTRVARFITSTQRSGGIVNIASALAFVASDPMPHAPYCAAKAAVVAMTRQLACEWSTHDISVNALAPGWFPTELTKDFLATSAGEELIHATVPARRPGRLDELDGPLLLLTSRASSYLTGQTIIVDGGWTIR